MPGRDGLSFYTLFWIFLADGPVDWGKDCDYAHCDGLVRKSDGRVVLVYFFNGESKRILCLGCGKDWSGKSIGYSMHSSLNSMHEC